MDIRHIRDLILHFAFTDTDLFLMLLWVADMLMDDPKPTFSYFVSRLRDGYPKLAYLHLIEPRVDGDTNTARDPNRRPARVEEPESNDFIREIWAPRPLITAGGYTRDTAVDVAEKKGDLIGFGRYFIANVSYLRFD